MRSFELKRVLNTFPYPKEEFYYTQETHSSEQPHSSTCNDKFNVDWVFKLKKRLSTEENNSNLTKCSNPIGERDFQFSFVQDCFVICYWEQKKYFSLIHGLNTRWRNVSRFYFVCFSDPAMTFESAI